MRKVHFDTDLGGDLDDLCALAMLLRWPGDEPVQITGITVVGDTGGRRTGMVRRVLEIAGRTDIPVAAGAETSGGITPTSLDCLKRNAIGEARSCRLRIQQGRPLRS